MAAVTSSVWAIDLGNNSLKALRLTDVNGVVEVIDFDNIKHGKILSGKGVQQLEKNELIAISLRQFMQNHEILNDDVIISLPSQNSFARFVTLPPVETKRIPEIIRFEAVQQIPFDINDVQWDWQLMEGEGGEEKKVGIFAIKSDVIDSTLEHFSREEMQVRHIQMAPMALYNYALYDRSDLSASDESGIVILNIGAEYSDLVVCTKSTVWQRCIPMGGNSFTKAISEAFRINFEKAEKLKRNATMSKYARQVLQAMKPVFADLASEIQRSIGFYTSSNPEMKLSKIVAMGGGTKMRGLVKYLQQSLQMPIERPDSFEKLAIAPNISAARFHENVCDFGIVYGLGLQALGLGRIESNLLPRSIARSMAWANKARYFVAAAILLLLVSVFSFGRVLWDKGSYRSEKGTRDKIEQIAKRARLASERLEEQKEREIASQSLIQKQLDLFKYREVIPKLMETIISMLPNEENLPSEQQKQLHRAFAANDVEAIKKIERKERKQLFITGISVHFAEDLSAAEFGETDSRRRTTSTTRTSRAATGKGSKEERQMRTMEEYYLRMRGAQAQDIIQPEVEDYTVEEPEKQEAENLAGFVVTITGYSPYRNINELMEPLEVGSDRDRWGFITRLKNLNVIFDGKSTFELYEKNNPKHYKPEIKPVELLSTPPGIGVLSERKVKVKSDIRNIPQLYTLGQAEQEERYIVEQILIDPMTRETISKVAMYKEDGTPVIDTTTNQRAYEINDHWFELKMKFLWKDAPKEIVELAQK